MSDNARGKSNKAYQRLAPMSANTCPANRSFLRIGPIGVANPPILAGTRLLNDRFAVCSVFKDTAKQLVDWIGVLYRYKVQIFSLGMRFHTHIIPS